jgi:hypothetical protein
VALGYRGWRVDRRATLALRDGSDWVEVISNGFGDTHNEAIRALQATGGAFYAVSNNYETGAEVWRSTDGTTWSQVSPDGFGDSVNYETHDNNAIATVSDRLYVGTTHWYPGGEVWTPVESKPIYLPLVLR